MGKKQVDAMISLLETCSPIRCSQSHTGRWHIGASQRLFRVDPCTFEERCWHLRAGVTLQGASPESWLGRHLKWIAPDKTKLCGSFFNRNFGQCWKISHKNGGQNILLKIAILQVTRQEKPTSAHGSTLQHFGCWIFC